MKGAVWKIAFIAHVYRLCRNHADKSEESCSTVTGGWEMGVPSSPCLPSFQKKEQNAVLIQDFGVAWGLSYFGFS